MGRTLFALAAITAAALSHAQPPARDSTPGFRVDRWTTDDGLPSHSVLGIAQTRDGYLWLATPGGLARFDGRSFDVYTSGNVPDLPSSRVRLVVAGAGDTLWIELEQHGVFALTGGRAHPMPDSKTALALFGAARGQDAAGRGAPPRLRDASGALWVSTRGGIDVLAASSNARVARFGVPSAVVSMVEDREGNIWCGTSEHGVWRIQRTAFRVMAQADGFADAQVWSLSRGDGNSVFASDVAGRLFRVADGAVRLVPNLPSVAGVARGALTAYGDSRGTIWYGVGRRNERGFLIGRRAGVPDLVIERTRTPMRIIEDPDRGGRIWFHDGAQVYRAEPYGELGARVARTWGIGAALRDLTVDRTGNAWLAGADLGGHGLLVRIANDSLRRFTATDGLPRNELRVVVADRDNVLWIGTYGAGIYRYKDGQFRAVSARDGLAEDIVSSILIDDADNFWMSGNRGIHRVSRAALTAFLDGRSPRVDGVAYSRRDGLRNPESSGMSAVRARDGRLWFPTYDGAAVVDPVRAVALDAFAPLVHIERIAADGDTVPVIDAARLPRGRRQLEFGYEALSLRNPDALRFQYRLDGVDAAWVDAGASRTAVYNHVRPGRYTFRVRAMNGGAVWSAQDATLTVGVPHYFHETRMFVIGVLLSAIGLVYGAHRYRVGDLERRRATLNRIVDERTAALATEKQRTEGMLRTVSAQAEQLRSLDEAKSRFFANVSHEFRTPLSLILGPLEDIRGGRAGPVGDAMGRKLDTVINSGRRLVRLVEQLLDVARLESGALQLHADVHDIVAYLRHITESFSSHAERCGVAFVVSCPVGGIRARFDTDQMDKVFGNLLGNAFKFTRAGGRVELRVTTEGVGVDALVVVSVRDTGIGIPPEHLARVFDRFYQVDDSARREHEGAGIGLALTKELVELHGGTIGAESVAGEGSTFTVRLPLATGETRPLTAPTRRAPVAAEAAAREPMDGRDGEIEAEPDGGDRTTVLLVEDNAELLAYLKEHLETRYRVLEAYNGAAALHIARTFVPDLVVSDIMMPEMDGQALCQAIKSDREIDFVPVILLTAKASRESRLAGLELGADDYLTKPVDLRELFVRADNLIMSRRRLRERFREEQRTLPTLAAPRAQLQLDTTSEAFVRKLYDAFATHIGDDTLAVDAIAKDMSMSRRTLYRHCEGALGRSPMDALREYRLDQAAQWLRETDADVSEIAYGVGFKSVPHFCGRFRKRFGMTPSGYRADTAPIGSDGA